VDVLSAYKLQYEKALEQMEENDKLVAGIRSDYSRLKSESEKYNHNLELHLAEKQRLKTDFLRVSNDLKSLNQSYDALSNTKKDLSQQIDTLQAEIRKLKQTASNAIANNNTGDLEKEITNLKSDLAKKEKELQRLGGEKILLQAQQEQLAMGGLFTHKVLEDDLQKKEKEVDSLGGEKILLQAKMEQLTMGGLFTHQVLEYDIEKKQHKEEPAANKEDEIIQRIKAKAANINFERIGKVDASQKDDLQRVKGIGPFIERKLNALGIYKFVQIARFTEEDEEKVNEAIEFFAGRVKRDEWAKQAAVFAKEKGEI
ncbi:MAG: hypothetical protein KDD49_05895, partial [Bacteroidetes bacterium]|nr:hypothetical protein [Bacteroidota bacterium]